MKRCAQFLIHAPASEVRRAVVLLRQSSVSHLHIFSEKLQKRRVDSGEEVDHCAQLGVRNLPRHVAQLPEPKAPQEMRRRLGNNVDGLEWVALLLFSFLRNYYWNASFQRGDLPVDMQHF